MEQKKVQSTIKKFVQIRFFLILTIVLAVLLVGGVMIYFGSAGLVETEAVITDIDHYYDDVREEEVYTTLLTFTDENEIVHGVVTEIYNSGMKVGDTITVAYDPEHPENVSSSNGNIVGMIMMIVAGAGILFALFKIVTILKKSPEEMLNMNRVSEDRMDSQAAEDLKNSDEQEENYVFHFTGKLGQSYILKTASGTPMIEAVCEKMGIFKPSSYLLVDHATGRRDPALISHTVSTSYGSDNIYVTTDSSFKINGENCWDRLAAKGFSLEPVISGIKVSYKVYQCGVQIGTIEQAGRNVMVDASHQTKMGDVLTTPGIYRISCRPSALGGVFLACFILSRCR